MESTDYKIASLAQTHQQLVKSKTSLKQALSSIDLSQHDMNNLNYSVCGKSSIESVMQSIPPEETLVNMVSQASKQFKVDCINNYMGDYKLVKELQQRLDNAKCEAVDTYFLVTQVRPVHLGSACEYIKENGHLHSCNIYGEEEKTCKYEKNSLHHKYREDLKLKENSRIASIPQTNLLRQNQLIIHVAFYDSHISQKQNEFICYGQQLLTQLRDKFYCLMQQLQPPKSRSSFIFIDNVFYNDLRYGNHNLSENIIAKARVSSTQYISLSMEKTHLSDLRVEVGRPYVFRHLQGCDHMIVFNQVRLIDLTLDLRDSKSYPINVYEKRLKRRKCEGCDIRFATLIVLDDKMKNGEHGYYCDLCHTELHLDIEGEPKYKGMIVIKYLHD